MLLCHYVGRAVKTHYGNLFLSEWSLLKVLPRGRQGQRVRRLQNKLAVKQPVAWEAQNKLRDTEWFGRDDSRMCGQKHLVEVPNDLVDRVYDWNAGTSTFSL